MFAIVCPISFTIVNIVFEFRFQFFHIVIDDSPMTNMMDDWGTCPCFCPYLSPFRREDKLVL